MSRLKRGPGHLEPENYFRYRLWDEANPAINAAETFLGTSYHRQIIETSLGPYLDFAKDDQAVCELLRSYDLHCVDPVPPNSKVQGDTGDKSSAASMTDTGFVRFFSIIEDMERIEILRACWRIPIEDLGAATAHLTAHIDVDSGTIVRAVRQTTFDYEEVDAHPTTGSPLKGLTVPDWKELASTARSAAAIIPGCRVQSWDVAAGAECGVLIRFLPGGGDPYTLQLGADVGLLTGAYAQFASDSLNARRRDLGKSLSFIGNAVSHQTSNLKQYSDDGPDSDGATADLADDAEFRLDTDVEHDDLFAKQLKLAVDKHGADRMTIISDTTKLIRKPTRLPPNEYFLYRLWDSNRFDASTKRTFIGTGQWQAIHTPLMGAWNRLAEDKLITNAILKSNGLPITETQAIYHPFRHFPAAEQLKDRQAVNGFLRHRARYPLFGKPVSSQLSVGSASLDSYSAATDEILMANGSMILVDAFVDQISPESERPPADEKHLMNPTDGYLFQTRLTPHPALQEILGHRTGTVRMIFLCDGEEPELVRASWKVPTGRNVADNYWRKGNLLAGLELETGRIEHLLRSDPSGYENLNELPGTGKPAVGMIFPEWPAMLATATAACKCMPGCLFQGWDIALCDTGPVLVELQPEGGNPLIAQLGYKTGILSDRYNEALSKAAAIAKDRV